MQPRAETKTGEKSEDKEWVGDRLGAEVDGQEKKKQAEGESRGDAVEE